MRQFGQSLAQQVVFTANGVWLCPADVTSIEAIGFGGGGSGAGGSASAFGGPGGGGTLQSCIAVAVVPGTLYQIVIGAGGASVGTDTAGLPGVDTVFSIAGGATLATWSGASGGQAPASAAAGGRCFKATGGGNATGFSNLALGVSIIADGGYFSSTTPHEGRQNVVGGFNSGQVGAANTGFGGSGGGSGPEGVGGNGGAGGTTSSGSPGVGGGSNTGAGGGGGGGAGSAGSGGASGAGGSGKLYLNYASSFANPILPSVVQFATWETSFNLGLTPVFPNNVTAGNTIVVICVAGGNSTPVVYNVPTDAEGNTYVAVPNTAYNDATNQWQAAVFVAFNAIGGSTNTVTVTYTGGAAGGGTDVYIAEVSGAIGVEGGSSLSNANSATASTGNILMTRANGIIVAGTLQNGSSQPSLGNGPGCVLIQRTPNNAACFEYATGVSGSLNVTANLQGTMSWLMTGVGLYGTN